MRILATRPSATFVDRGRPGWAHLGVAESGAADRHSYELGQRLLEHDDGGAAIEVTMGGLALRADALFTVALTGADPSACVDGRPVGMNAPFLLLPGQTLALGQSEIGLRTYVAVRGGFDVAPVLGSRSTDLLSGLGPALLAAGDELRVGAPRAATFAGVDQAPVAPWPGGPIEVDVVFGPRDDWFAAPAELTARPWTVSAKSNRIGARLEGATLARHPDRGGELPTEGVVRGAVQVPPNGQPVVFLADHPVTGGYPVVAVATAAGVDRVAQAGPGDRIQFRAAAHPPGTRRHH